MEVEGNPEQVAENESEDDYHEDDGEVVFLLAPYGSPPYSLVDPSIKNVQYIYKEGPIRHKQWPIQTVADWQDCCRQTRQLQTVKTAAD